MDVIRESAELEVSSVGQTVAIHKPFNPEEYGLDSGFRLTKFSEMRGCGCKVPQKLLHRLLEGLQPGLTAHDGNHNHGNSHASHQHYFHEEMGLPKIGSHLHL